MSRRQSTEIVALENSDDENGYIAASESQHMVFLVSAYSPYTGIVVGWSAQPLRIANPEESIAQKKPRLDRAPLMDCSVGASIVIVRHDQQLKKGPWRLFGIIQ